MNELRYFDYYYILLLKGQGRYSSDIVIHDLVAVPEPRSSKHFIFKHVHTGIQIRVPMFQCHFLNNYTIEVNNGQLL